MFRLCGFLLLSRLFMQGFPLMKRSESEYLDQARTAVLGDDVHVRKAAHDSLLKYSLTGDEQEALVDKLLKEIEKSLN